MKSRTVYRLYRVLWLAMLICLGMTMAAPGWAQSPEDLERAEIGLALRERQLEAERMEAELNHQNQMHKLETEARRVEIDLMRGASRKHDEGIVGVLFLVGLVVHILMALWVYSDNRSRDAGQGIWIVITLLAGFFGALVYAVIRLADLGKTAPRSTSAKRQG